MPSFFIRNLSRYIALSIMGKNARPSTPSNPDKVAEGVVAWNKNMRWLIPFFKASGYRVVIDNPKSHQTIVIDKDTKSFPRLKASWLRRYDKKEFAEWKLKEKNKEEARRSAEKRGRAKYGNSFKVSDEEIQ